jgi:prolyl 4-hydroxylase
MMKTIQIIVLLGVLSNASSEAQPEAPLEVPAQVPKESVHENTNNHDAPIYGYDTSFPMLSKNVTTNYPWLPHNVDPANNPTPTEYEHTPIQPLGDRQKFYEDYIQGCRDYWKDHEDPNLCDDFEEERINHNLDQPKCMVNYTDVGYKKIRAPEHVMKLLLDFWEANKYHEVDENFPAGSIFVNYWASDSKFVNVEDDDYEGGGEHLVDELWESSVDAISEWTGQKLMPSSLYGIRVYAENSVLAPHVDRLPLISSAIINVAQDVDEPWPLEVIGHDGIARNITMEPGDLVLYESHSVMHGRPYPLKGRYFANVFIHFEPDPDYINHGESDLPPYVLEGSSVAKDFRAGEYDGDIPSEAALRREEKRRVMKLMPSHGAAYHGDLDTLIDLAKTDAEALFAEDENGWQPIHEAVRSGHEEVVEFLHSQGADVNARTRQGHSPLAIALEYWGEEDSLYEFLLNVGGMELGPDL